MPAAYYPAFHVGVIDTDGYFQPLGSAVLDVEDITTSTSLGTIAADAEGYVAEGSHGVSPGDIVEYSHGSYPLKFRQTVTTTQDEAYLHPENSTIRYILENSYASTSESKFAKVYIEDLDDPTQKPFFAGIAVAGETTKIPYQSSIAKNLRLHLVSIDESGAQDVADLAYSQSEDLAVPSIVPTTGLTGNFLNTGFSINDSANDHRMNLTVGEDFTADRTLSVTLGNANRAVAIEADLLVAGNATISGTNTGDTITIGTTPIASGGANRLLFHSASGNYVQESANLTFDGNSLLVQTSSASAVPLTVKGAASQSANYLEVKRSDGFTLCSIDEDAIGGVLNIHGNNGAIGGFYRINTGGVTAGMDVAGYNSLNLINQGHATDALILRAFGNAGGTIDVKPQTYYSNWLFTGYTGAGTNGGEVVMTDANSGLETFHCYQSNNSNMGVRFPNGKIIIGGTGVPDAKLHIVSTTEQLRIGYDLSNYYKTTVGSTGGVTFDAVGSGAKFTFSDAVEVPDDAYASGWNANVSVPTKNALYDHFSTQGWVKNNATLSAPSSSDDDTQGYSAGSIWVDLTAPEAYICVDASTASAAWILFA